MDELFSHLHHLFPSKEQSNGLADARVDGNSPELDIGLESKLGAASDCSPSQILHNHEAHEVQTGSQFSALIRLCKKFPVLHQAQVAQKLLKQKTANWPSMHFMTLVRPAAGVQSIF